MIKKTELKSGYSIFGNKGNVWSNTAHIYQSGNGNLCGTPALSSNHAGYAGIDAGCEKCCAIYKEQNS
jgi:hypothetical protein